jgi:hypothetical protein
MWVDSSYDLAGELMEISPLAKYENAAAFDGFRFSRERAEQKLNDDPGKDIFKRHMVSTAVDHLPFGNGKHACPVRCSLQLGPERTYGLFNKIFRGDFLRPQS